MAKVKNELEDLAFRYLDPAGYESLAARVEERRQRAAAFVEKIRTTVAEKLRSAGVEAEIEGRIKRLHSIQQKLKRQRIDLEQVYDFVALRVLVKSVPDCYAALGVLHNTWRPVPGRIKDFIAMPRPNGYQSLHTSVISEDGHPFEVQIRTHDMHRIAEEGIAAHWKYKEGRTGVDKDDHAFSWLRQLLEWQQEVKDPHEFLNSLKLDLYPEEVYCFTPKGEVKMLPRGRLADRLRLRHPHRGRPPVRRARASTARWCRCATSSRTATSSRSSPRPATSRAATGSASPSPTRPRPRSATTSTPPRSSRPSRSAASTSSASCAATTSRSRRSSPSPRPSSRSRRSSASARASTTSSPPSATARSRSARCSRGSSRRRSSQAPPEKPRPVVDAVKRFLRRSDERITVKGTDDLLVYRAKCCNPIMGEPIVGYITRGKGVSVHSVNCPNVTNLVYDPDRRIAVEWEAGAEGGYEVRLAVDLQDRPGALAAVTAALAAMKTDVRDAQVRTFDDKTASIEITVRINDLKHLDKVLKSVRGVSGVIDVARQAVPR